MKRIFVVFIPCVVVITSVCFNSSAQFAPVAVIELFSSQGCSSCPPADKLLSKTIAATKKDGRKIFALEFHVDYWNRLGWSDPFSDKKYTERQDEYASALGLSSVYTPQMIVNGKTEFVGSDEGALADALTKALQTKSTTAFKTLTASLVNGKPHIQYSLDGDYAGCKVNLALLSLSETTTIKRGENGGRTLTNENVVRQFISEPAKATGETDFAAPPLPAKNNMAVIAYIQRTADSKIVGAAQVEIH